MSSMIHEGTPPAGPLTTPFSATNTYCSTGVYRYTTPICMPPNWDAYWSGKVGYYSPAICPAGYTSAGIPDGAWGPHLETTETAIACCPSGYYYDNSATSYCYSNYATRGSSALRSTTIITSSTVTSTSYSTSYSSYPTEGRSSAYLIQVRWAASDLPALATDPSTPGKTPGHSGLSTGAKVGIGVGVAIGVLAVALGVLLLFCRRRRKSPNASSNIPTIDAKSSTVYGSQVEPNNNSQPYEAPGDTSYNTSIQQSSSLSPYLAGEQASRPSSASARAIPQGDVRLSSELPEVVPEDYQRLQSEQERIQQRRMRLLELQRLDEEENRVRGEMRHLSNSQLS